MSREPEIKESQKYMVAYIHHVGPYNQLGDTFKEVFGWVSKKGLRVAGPPIGIFYDNPEDVQPENQKSDVCVPFIGEASGDDRVQVKDIPSENVAITIHEGQRDEYAKTYDILYTWIFNQGYIPNGHPRELYLEGPEVEGSEEKIKAEIHVPVRKREKENGA